MKFDVLLNSVLTDTINYRTNIFLRTKFLKSIAVHEYS